MADRVNASRARLGMSTVTEDQIWQLLTGNEDVVMLPRGARSLFESVRDAMRGSAEVAPAPASRASIEALAVVTNRQKDKCEEDCPICLEKLFGKENKERVKEMPCGHRYHGDCIEKWLHVDRLCPVCRHKMPPEEEEEEDYDDIGFWFLIPH